MNIVVIGMGYVGIPCAALFADVPGFDVVGVQRRSERSGWKIECLNSGGCPFEGDEPGLAELLRRVTVDKKSLRVTDGFAACGEADAILIDVQTPTDGDHVPHYESLRQASAEVGARMRRGTLVVVESTVAPGTIQHVVQPILERESRLQGGEGFHLAFSYERVMPGKLLEYIINFPRVVGGIDPESTRRAVALYRHIVKAEITPADVLTAEMAKVVENAYRDVNIAFANEVALLCESMGVNVTEVRELINARPDRHMLVPGAGVGGHCLPKDSWLLRHGVQTYGQEPPDMRIIPVAREINDGMPEHMVDLIERALGEREVRLENARVAILGVAYLENADDTRNTPAATLAQQLASRGAGVIAHDPYVREADWRRSLADGQAIPLTSDLWEALQDADCLALVTRHREYGTLDWSRVKRVMRTPAVVDGRGAWVGAVLEAAGFAYAGVGQGKAGVARSPFQG